MLNVNDEDADRALAASTNALSASLSFTFAAGKCTEEVNTSSFRWGAYYKK